VAFPWMAAFRTIPWTEVIRAAPSIVQGAKDMLHARNRESGFQAEEPLREKPASESGALAGLAKRVHTLERRVFELGQELIASAEVIRSLAEQNARLVESVEILRVRTRALLACCGLLGVAAVALAWWVLVR
jgi:hypothetical protein